VARRDRATVGRRRERTVTDPATPIVPWSAPVEPTGPAPGVEFAPHGPRLLAYLIDSLILFLAFVLISIVGAGLVALAGGFDEAALASRSPSGLVILIGLAWFAAIMVVSIGYFPFFWRGRGQTPGMRPFHLVVVRDKDGQSFGWGTAWLRLLGLYVASSVFYLGFVWILIDKRHRGWQDLIAGTLVIKRP
jgi:uncharacterized RDD family membrane protein YckC